MKFKTNTMSLKSVSRVAWVTIFIASIYGCAHGPEKENALDAKLSSESELANYADLRTEAEKVLNQNTDLTNEQKSKLINLKVETATKLDSLQKEMLKLKGTLVRNIVADKYQAKEVLQIEKRIESLSKQKLATFFESLEKGSKILGKVSTKEQILQELRLERNFRIFREGPMDRF